MTFLYHKNSQIDRCFILFFLFISLHSNAQERFTVYFDFDIDEANPASETSLEKWIATHKDAEVLKIYGYADSTGNALYNQDLSERRAMYVYEQLKEADIALDSVDERGFGETEAFSPDRAKDRKAVLYFRTKPKPKPKPVVSEFVRKVGEAKKGDRIKVPNLHFLNNSGQVLPESKPALYELLSVMRDNPRLKIDIQGHICCIEKEQNEISKKRAITVYTFLIRNGIDQSRLTYQSFGSSRPIYPLPEKSEGERAANRRVEIEIIEN
ncbi:OmpA family protein [Flavobacterium sp. MFBS3-15]|uniref:OmpA family protein n=1 Tax=Flavobacterium sp. MFBS3-15 TaxID=2989816 RepID=UPI002235573C|nr:OmpA family protein [Flavobacterium sp. MFBS3-15]MCW4469600.1 OmpA family protein [Flavobacterium sp. MFBS3-15]